MLELSARTTRPPPAWRRLRGARRPSPPIRWRAETLSAWLPSAALPEPGAAVSAYWPFRTEIDPRPLMARLAAAGARLALPVTPPKGAGKPLCFHLWAPQDGLHPSTFGVHEPHPSQTVVEPDLLLVPLLAFDRRGGRLGYGAGHYDRTLQDLRAREADPRHRPGLRRAGDGPGPH